MVFLELTEMVDVGIRCLYTVMSDYIADQLCKVEYNLKLDINL